MKISQGETLLFTGDSITDCKRERPVGEGAGLGHGYVALTNALLTGCQPELNIRILNTGISGNRVIDLERRWETDVLQLRPDWLSIMIGINDVWHHFKKPDQEIQVSAATYENTYRRLLEKTRPRLKGLVLMTPYIIEADPADPMRKHMDEYSAIVERLAPEFDAVFVSLQDAFDRYLAHKPSRSLAEDRVHPNNIGHTIIAASFLKAIGFEWRGEDRNS